MSFEEAEQWIPPRGKGYHRKAISLECARVIVAIWPDQESVYENVTSLGMCHEGCCSDYKCNHCGYQWRIEFPD